MLDNHANTPTLRYCLYARKSSESDERQAMSIDSQLSEMRSLAERDGLNVVCELQESHSAKDSGKRPQYNKLIKAIANDEYDAILTWAPDRLSRNAGDLGSIVDLMDQGKLLHIKTFSQTFTNNPNEKFLLMILCSQAKLENDNKSINVKRGIKAKCEMGWRPGVAPLGYINRSLGGVTDIIPDPERSEVIVEMFHKASQGWSRRRLKAWMDTQSITTRNGKPVPLSSILNMLINPFYYGEFQYPEGSNATWYKGAHKPLVSRELWDEVQQSRGDNKVIWGSKQFAFRGLISCGQCGASFTAQEKFKKLKNGEYNRHIYYSCTRRVDPSCNEKYINDKNLRILLQKFIELHYKEIEINDKLRAKVDKHQRTTEALLGYYGIQLNLTDKFIEFARYTLNQGTEQERSLFALGILTKLCIRDGEMQILVKK